jgi:hypothetical protein
MLITPQLHPLDLNFIFQLVNYSNKRCACKPQLHGKHKKGDSQLSPKCDNANPNNHGLIWTEKLPTT